MIFTDTWCSSGKLLRDDTLLQTAGGLDGVKKIKKFNPCPEMSNSTCDWEELEEIQLSQGRWYATNKILPDGFVIIIGGSASLSCGGGYVSYNCSGNWSSGGGVAIFLMRMNPEMIRLHQWLRVS
ncbi:hypothetical protein M9H77_03360 [Catharanthus roseus]|uniref:Uncharacterized protein n=1 Tax=Catharanthus roseus TaxID=4058 RepID=A0ACC0CB10_CATRO|nr:hypothetical protein M9H77_03360 [Catharanthus roseus]